MVPEGKYGTYNGKPIEVDANNHLTASDTTTGKVEAGKTKEVVYVYREKTIQKTGDVVLHYVSLDGEEIQPPHHNSDDKPVGEGYTVLDKETGVVVKGKTDVTYIYKLKETPESGKPGTPGTPGTPPVTPEKPENPEVPENPEDPSMPEAPKEKPAEPGQPTPEQPGQNKGEVKKSAVLPNTGETSTLFGWSAAALSILAGLGLVATGRKKEDEEA
ncbi:LPXTG cell wall anchor domain-containing protein [Tuanshanicoccus lijuaniae]|uniref:LPXTG cell wall anchor domain-containing protein n=1 Tax=Aerococcaceae bacterium zg-1292 TaxID=2774330 RepID=UPI001BD84EE5|nr:LPXTG cell wall anchor domain-containing protein [Aerococcaceae bacterium zg-A91]MBS4458852.1 LPXTG cell wall anchor domain-containing protein [Aerococcaceae bacterium zg-BR33]